MTDADHHPPTHSRSATVRGRNEPHQPGRDADRGGRPAARAPLGDGPALGRRLPLGRPRAARRLLRRSARSARRSASTATSRTGASRPGRRSKATLAILGCMTMQGPLTQWVTDHRKHHALSDQPGDPHSPHVGHEDGAWGAVRGLRARARRLALRQPRAWSRAASTARTSTRTGSSARSTASTCVWVVADARPAVR